MDENKKETKILDLDALVPPDKVVKLGGKTLNVSGGASTKTMLHLLRIGQEIEESKDDPGELARRYEEIYEVYWELFKGKNSEMTFDMFKASFDPIRHGPALSSYITAQVKEAEKKTE